jgi:hypothetical protein
MKHIIVTRCKFDCDETFKNYLPQIINYYVPTINSQKNKSFEIGLISHENHFNQIRCLVDKKINMIRFDDAKKDYKDYVVDNDITIQTRHDCDDFMNDNYIEHIQNLYEENKNIYDNFILNFHPNKLDIETNTEYVHPRDYSRVCSMFSTLIQRKVEYGVMDVIHDYLSRITKNIIYIKQPFVKLIIHKHNLYSKL